MSPVVSQIVRIGDCRRATVRNEKIAQDKELGLGEFRLMRHGKTKLVRAHPETRTTAKYQENFLSRRLFFDRLFPRR